MIDLHVHLDGSVRLETMIQLAKEQRENLPSFKSEKLKEYILSPTSMNNFADYIKRFDLSLALLQSRHAIHQVMYELVRDLDNQGLLYAEIRLTPQSHILKGLTQHQVVDAALDAMHSALRDSKQIKTNLILCTMRGADEKDNFETVVETVNAMGKGVSGMDLLGDEIKYGTQLYEGQFRLLREENIPFTVHAGVMVGADSIEQAIEYGASRIGHGVRAKENPKLMELLKEKEIVLEMCPTSNVVSQGVASIQEHPIGEYLREGLKVTVGTDDMTICDINLKKEYDGLRAYLGFTDEDILQINLNGARGAFVSSYERRQLEQRVKEKFQHESTT